MNTHFISRKNDVDSFLKKIRFIVNNENFKLEVNFKLLKRSNDLSNSIYTNYNTLMILNYKLEDVINEICMLNNDDYYETIMDVLYDNILLYVFKKVIKENLIYIKLTIENEKIIVCISFHISNK